MKGNDEKDVMAFIASLNNLNSDHLDVPFVLFLVLKGTLTRLNPTHADIPLKKYSFHSYFAMPGRLYPAA